MSNDSKRWVLAARPGPVMVPTDFELQTFTPPDLQDGQVRVRVRAHSLSPGVRARLTFATYASLVQPGDPIPGAGVGVVEASRHAGFAVGDKVTGDMGWTTDSVIGGDALTKLDPALYGELPLETALGALGVNGLTAYVGVLEVGRAKAGETVLVSSAAGSVGYLAGQIAKISGCGVVGIAGSDAKCRDLTTNLGFDDAINYRSEGDLTAAIKAHRPDGIAVFFDNVGGRTLNAGVQNLRNFGRAVICGRTADYTEGEAQVSGLSPSRRLTLQTFIVYDYPEVLPVARQRIAAWLREGKLIEQATMRQGIETSAIAFIQMFEGGATGRALVQVS